MVLLPLPRSSMQSKKVPFNGILTEIWLIRYLLGFNMGNDLAISVTYAAFLVDGNMITNLLSIGGKTPKTGPDPPKPAIVGGLDTHSVLEGAPPHSVYCAYYLLIVVMIQVMLV